MTPQEAYDEEKRINPTTTKEDLLGCLVDILYLGIIIFIAYILL